MAVGQRSEGVLGSIQRLFGRGTVSGLSEGQLLSRFALERDEIAFEAIVSRHGPMVLGICRRLLDDPHDVEDAFQATFLVLVRRAGSLRDRDLLSNWLYGVALKVASRARRDRVQRRIGQRSNSLEMAVASPEEPDLGELRSVLDSEVARLPDRFRAPIVLCYFEGLTHDQAAERLRCPVGTVRSRMAKAREILRSRLSRRGLGPESAIPSAPMAGLSPAVPPALLFRTAATSSSVVGRSLIAGAASSSAIALARGVLRTMTFTKWMTIAAAAVALGAVGGVRVAARQDGAPSATKQAAVASADDGSRSARKALEDLQSWINRHDTEIASRRAEIEDQKKQIADLHNKIRALEAKSQADTGKVASPKTNTDTAHSFEASRKEQPGDKGPVTDRVMMGPGGTVVSISGAKDRVIIYTTNATAVGRSRTYRLPHDMTSVSVSFHGEDVTIVANGRNAAHLANYNWITDRWALQDIRSATNGRVEVLQGEDPQGEEFVLPCRFQGSAGFTQVAVFDRTRGVWSIQNLLEPSETWVAPVVQGKLAIYVVGRHAYAYSAAAGTWDTLSLEEPLLPGFLQPRSTGGPVLIQDGLLAVSQHGRLYIFKATTGRWETINPKD